MWKVRNNDLRCVGGKKLKWKKVENIKNERERKEKSVHFFLKIWWKEEMYKELEIYKNRLKTRTESSLLSQKERMIRYER